jgi:hypothetical protein
MKILPVISSFDMIIIVNGFLLTLGMLMCWLSTPQMAHPCAHMLGSEPQ